MSSTVSVTRTVQASLQDILDATPNGKRAMFRVTSISSNVEDWVCGEHVYVQDNKICDFISETARADLSEVSLHFINYVED